MQNNLCIMQLYIHIYDLINARSNINNVYKKKHITSQQTLKACMKLQFIGFIHYMKDMKN